MASNRAQILISAIDQTKTAFDSIKRGLSGLTDVARGVNGVLANLGAAVSVAGLTAMVKSAIDTGDALDEMSQRVGVSVETLSVWKPAAEQSGVSGESFEKGLRKLATTMVEAATGSETAARGFSAVGVEFKNHDGTLRATDQVLLDLADRFKAMPDGAQKAALAVQLFGKSGAELIPFLNQGRDGIDALATEMQALGVQMSSETAAQAGTFNDALDKLKLAGSSIGNQIISSLLPALNDMAGGMVESAKQGGSLRAILDGIVLALKVLALGAATVGKAFVALGEAIGGGIAAAVLALSGNVDAAKTVIADLKGNLVRRLDELASFRDSLFDPKPIEIKTPKIQADPEVLEKLTKPSTGKAGDAASARTSLVKAQLDAEFGLLKAGLDRQQSALDQALDDRLISIRDYYTRKTGLDQQAIDAEIARKQAELARNRQVADTGTTENDRLRAKAEVAKAESELISLNHRRAEVEQANARAAAQAERELADALAGAREELAQITGSATDADRRAAIERSYRELKTRLLAENDAGGASLVDRLIDVKAAQANLAALEAQWRQVAERLRNAQDAIQTQQQAGLLTESQARAQIVSLQQQSATEMERLLPTMQQAAAAIGPEAVTRVQSFRNELARTRLVVDEVAIAISGGAQDALARMFESIATGAATAREAFLQFGQSVLQMIARIAAQKLAQQIFSAFAGASGGGGGAGFATGGYVSGPGTSTSDSIPARLSAGEYVLRATAVRRVGVAFLDAINGLSMGPRFSGGRLALADGGMVPPAASPAASSSAIRIVNVLDPALAADYLNSSAGERVVMNLIQRNASTVRTLLGT